MRTRDFPTTDEVYETLYDSLWIYRDRGDDPEDIYYSRHVRAATRAVMALLGEAGPVEEDT